MHHRGWRPREWGRARPPMLVRAYREIEYLFECRRLDPSHVRCRRHGGVHRNRNLAEQARSNNANHQTTHRHKRILLIFGPDS
jgi:hypothetical protein